MIGSGCLAAFVLIVGVVLLVVPGLAWDDAGESYRFSVTYPVTLVPEGDIVVATVDVLIPQTLPGLQKILGIRYSLQPDAVYDKGGNRYARFVIQQPKQPIEIAIEVDAEVYRYDFATVLARDGNRRCEKAADLKQWLIDEPYVEQQAPEIQEVARRVKGKDEEEIVRKSLEFVVKTLQHKGYGAGDHGAVWALREKKGDCTEFTDLFVSLCRANGLPARTQEGYLIRRAFPTWLQELLSSFDTPKHDWAEVYLTGYGWVPFDPLLTHVGRATFEQLKPVYLYLDCQRRNAVLNNHHYWAWTCTWKTGSKLNVQSTFLVNSRCELNGK
jgi:transglutaminase-like putative cysteine protease